jgi:CBS domain-containing protein
MRKLLVHSSTAIGLVLLSPAALADTQEDLQATVTKLAIYGLLAFVIVVAVLVYFMRSRDKRQSPLNKIFEHGEAIHAVAPDTLVTECARMMTASKIGALIVMDGERLTGIFTERDALTKVLAAGLDPAHTKVSAVMTKDPYCIPPTTTVSEAMQLITSRRFRHLPIVENGKVLAVVSSGDLTHWLVQDKLGDVKELVDLAARS